jgi:glycosyltransferase involved in cell wall biosynthesis
MNVLYVGHYNESSGWGQAARDYILALDHVGVSVVPRAINLGLANYPVPNRIRELEQQKTSDCDVIVQHVLPHYMQYDSFFKKNIGLFVVETQNIKHTAWIDYLNIMDELWVPCTSMLNMEGVKPPMKLVPHTFNMDKYNKPYSTLQISQFQDKFIFYFVGEHSRRKHLAALLRAYSTEFMASEPVLLVVKVNKPGLNAQELGQEMTGFSNKIKDNLRLYQNSELYPDEIFITAYMQEEELMSLHQAADCFVCPSFGEAWCIPAFDAMAMGNIVVATRTGGPADYIQHNQNGYTIEGLMEPVFGEHDGFATFGTSRELETSIPIFKLQKTMRYIFENRDKLDVLRQNAKDSAHKYSYEQVGNTMKELIHA